MNNIIPVFFATDDSYVKYLMVTLTSMEDHMSQENFYQINILNTGLSLKSRKLLNRFKKDNVSINFYNIALDVAKMDVSLDVRDYYSKATYYRLLIPELFPNLDKALYLDCDIVILDDIANLYNTNIGDNLLGAVSDASVTEYKEFSHYVKTALDIYPKHYFNAGVLIMNLEEMRRQHFVDSVISLLSRFTFVVAQDQDILNVICKDQVKYLDGGWNQMPIGNYNDNARLIHYNLIYKPWNLDNIMYENYFFDYARKAGIIKEIMENKSAITNEQKATILSGVEKVKQLCLMEAANQYNYYNSVANNYLYNASLKYGH